MADQAIEQAKRLDEAAARNKFPGPLHRLLVAHKDLVETKGTTFGSPIFKDNLPNLNALMADCIQMAGTGTLGETIRPNWAPVPSSLSVLGPTADRGSLARRSPVGIRSGICQAGQWK